MPKEMIVATVSEFGQVVSIRLQLIGLWQKAIVEFVESSQADQLAAKWSFLIGKDSVRVAKAVQDREMIHCAVICFENDEDLESVFRTEPIFGGVKLSWARLDLVRCDQCEKLGHLILECGAEVSHSPKLSKSFKKIVSDETCLQLAKLYAKKSVPISRPAAFGSKSWAQVVSLASSSNDPHFGSGSDFVSSSGTSGLVGNSSLAGSVGSILETHLTSLERSLELLMDKVSGIIDKLDSLSLVPSALDFSSQPLAAPGLVNMKLGLDMVLDEPDSVVIPSSSVSYDTSSLGLSSSKVLTSKVDCLESKLVALEASVSSVLEKLDQMCAGSGSAVSFATR
ncbi:hypothetical protein G9A89_006804 [Geosiphon pyriformis]|nr:hypothetical protein G9A89_006804 [Geosiphon pyriformis]